MRSLRPVLLGVAIAALTAVSGCSSASPPRASSDPVPTPAPSTASTGIAEPSAPAASSSTARPPTSAPTSSRAPATTTRPSPTPSSGGTQRLPVRLPTASSRQVITVVAADSSSTTATLQAWQRSGESGDRWRRVGPAVRAFLGSDGSSSSPSESRSATPVGSFTLTRAFGHDPDPGTRLPYRRTTAADWWISQPGPLYNTLQRCSSHCPFTLGNPNEHLYYETPAYDYAVVIDYNTANASGGVKQGAGSAFFLHVSEGKPTAGCVSIPAPELLRVMRWLDPNAHPRILIGF